MTVIQNHQVSILVVDTDGGARALIREALISDGYTVRTASSTAEAVREFQAVEPALMVCDMNLGEESGLDLFAQLRNSTSCPVVFMSDSRRPDTVQRALRAGATYFLSKPFDPSVLLELVDKALWMPHLVRRHIDSASHRLKAPTFSPSRSSVS